MKKKIKEGVNITEGIKLWQSMCKHDKGLITNTGIGVGSKCVLCNKEMT